MMYAHYGTILVLFIYLNYFSSPIMGMSIATRGLQVDLVMALDIYIYFFIYVHLNIPMYT